MPPALLPLPTAGGKRVALIRALDGRCIGRPTDPSTAPGARPPKTGATEAPSEHLENKQSNPSCQFYSNSSRYLYGEPSAGLPPEVESEPRTRSEPATERAAVSPLRRGVARAARQWEHATFHLCPCGEFCWAGGALRCGRRGLVRVVDHPVGLDVPRSASRLLDSVVAL